MEHGVESLSSASFISNAMPYALCSLPSVWVSLISVIIGYKLQL